LASCGQEGVGRHSHQPTLPDVFAVTNHIIVIRRDQVTEKRTSETNSQEIVRYMVGALDDSQSMSATPSPEGQ
jgi:ABC-type sugar transport system ATPase subunit